MGERAKARQGAKQVMGPKNLCALSEAMSCRGNVDMGAASQVFSVARSLGD